MTFLDLARFLEAQIRAQAFPFPETAYRCAIGRAYYAAYGHAHKYARTWLAFQPKTKWEEKSQDHGALRAHLKSRRRKNVADRLELLRCWRNLCDYEDNLEGFDYPSHFTAAVAAADYVFQSLIPPPPSTGKL